MDTHQTELYKCRLSVCMGEADSLQALHQGVSYQSDEFNRTMSAAERANPIQLDTCRDGHTGRLCQVCPCSARLVVAFTTCPLAHALLAHNPPHTDAQACKDGYTVQGIYCGKCSGTADPTVKALAAPLGTILLLFIFGSWCSRPYFAKTEANLRRMASEQGAKLSSAISRHLGSALSRFLGTARDKMAREVQMQVCAPPFFRVQQRAPVVSPQSARIGRSRTPRSHLCPRPCDAGPPGRSLRCGGRSARDSHVDGPRCVWA